MAEPKYPVDLSKPAPDQTLLKDMPPDVQKRFTEDPALRALALGADPYMFRVHRELAPDNPHPFLDILASLVNSTCLKRPEDATMIRLAATVWVTTDPKLLAGVLRWFWSLGYAKALGDVVHERVIV